MKPVKEKAEALCHLLQEANSHPIQQAAADLNTYPRVQWVLFYKCCPRYLLIATALLCVLQMLK